MATQATDNSHFPEKVKLRERFIRTGQERILECYAGEGLIWDEIKRHYPGIQITRIEKQKGKNPGALPGDNLKYLRAIDLEQYDMIDLDAYGFPAEQIQAVAQSKFDGILFITAISSMTGVLPFVILEGLGFTRSQYRKCPPLICRDPIKKTLGFICKMGYTNSVGYQFGRKLYAAVWKAAQKRSKT